MTQAAPSVQNISIPILIGSAGLLSMSLIAYSLNNTIIPLWIISPHKTVNLTLTMQMIVLPISFIALVAMYFYSKENFKTFFRWSVPDRNSGWLVYGSLMAVVFTVGTTILVSGSVRLQNGAINNSFMSLIPIVLFSSVANAWSEEIFSRFVIVAGLSGKLHPDAICWISAILFGIPHFFGTPSGISGVIMSGALGWLLAKSVIETRGLGWALIIHCLQDIVIFGGGAMIIAGQN